MMIKRNGFTLIELLAVIVVLAIILAIAVPVIKGIIVACTRSAFESDAKMVLTQLKYETLKNSGFDVTSTTVDTIGNYNLSNENYINLNVALLDGKPYIIVIGKNKWAGLKACGTFQDMAVISITDDSICESATTYNDFITSEGVNRPLLAAGMTPIKWVNGVETPTTIYDSNWYNYSNKEWANAKTADGSYWVWIPRYAYQIAEKYHTNTAGTINIKFLIDNTNTTADNTAIDLIPTYSGGNQTNYIAQSAFTFGDTQLTGIWIAKFEASGAIHSVNVKPGVASLRGMTVGDMFTATRDMETNSMYGWGTSGSGIDTHMMKNTEWGATVYLAQSDYGKNSEIWINPSSSYITGCGGVSASVSSSSGCNYTYDTTNGMEASTTDNITGIYDMSGGAYEYTASYVNNGNSALSTNGSSIINADNKYKNVYSVTTDNQANNYANAANKHGDAVYETSSSYSTTTSWYGDSSYMSSTNLPYFNRGGINNNATGAGVFNFYNYSGAAYDSVSFRPVLAVGAGL